ncbi:hypothetical protein QVD17_01739 [Tagetes erecta]|uniref:Uncharacterized protein n=1 Tax=Tagetes erecta TaxID=13708 RepID=A0AAD8LB56_TARER|nr:hypothetical protein QVD17_01739 [Tagetes erecta]
MTGSRDVPIGYCPPPPSPPSPVVTAISTTAGRHRHLHYRGSPPPSPSDFLRTPSSLLRVRQYPSKATTDIRLRFGLCKSGFRLWSWSSTIDGSGGFRLFM